MISKSDRFLFNLSDFFFRAFRVFRIFPLRQFTFIKFPVETSLVYSTIRTITTKTVIIGNT